MRISRTLAVIGSLQFGLSGPHDCHMYALHGEDGVVVVDSGAGTHTQQVLQNLHLDFAATEVVALLITHGHMDHCGGAPEIRRCTGCKVVAPELSRKTLQNADEELSGLRAARAQGLYSADVRMAPCPVDLGVGDGQRFSIAGLDFTAIHVRGHSPDSHCYLVRSREGTWLFTGDVVFYGGVLGVINAEGSGMEGYRSDIHKLNGLDVNGLFPGHGLFTVRGGQRHVDCAIEQAQKGFVSRQIGQGDLIF